MKKKHKNRTGHRVGPSGPQAEITRWIGRLAAVAYEGRRDIGAGAVLQTADTLTYLPLANLTPAAAVLVQACQGQQFVVILDGGDRHGATVVTPGRPLAELHQRWGGTLEAST